MPAETYGSGTVPQIGDTERMLLVKQLLLGGGGGGSGNLLATDVDPTGVVSITGVGWAIGTGAMDGRLWKKTSAGAGTDWVSL